jgi:hypothetical protein
MSLGRILKDSFSPHEIAILGIVMTYALGGIALVAMFIGRFGFGIFLWLAAAIFWVTFYELSRCNGCSKSPMRRTQGDLNWLEYMNYVFRLWPERDCSNCGASLTGPEQN